VYSTPVWLLLGLSGAALVGSYLYILWAMWPRHHVRTLTASAAENLWFFGDIAAMSKDEHRNAMSKWAEPDVVAMLVSQNYILSKNVWVKHEALNRAILLTIAALVLLLALGLVYGVAMARGPLPQG
jgi:hypothetical protein